MHSFEANAHTTSAVSSLDALTVHCHFAHVNRDLWKIIVKCFILYLDFVKR